MSKKAVVNIFIAAAVGAAAIGANSASADVKAGVDAWSAGDYATAVREWSAPAQAGDPDAQFNLAQAYRLGRGVEADLAQAEALYRLAAAQGHVKAADNYGLLLFQNGRREDAMPYVEAAAGRGDPRAQYLLGVAHFNGDLVEKDWVRAYALLTLANGTGLPQARSAIVQMDQHIPQDQRQEAQLLAQQLQGEAQMQRSQQLASADLEMGTPVRSTGTQVAAAPAMPAATAQPVTQPVTVASGPASAGADYTLPSAPASAAVQPVPVPASAATREVERAQTVVNVASAPTQSVQPVSRPAAAAAPAMNGPWMVQLGAFGVAGGADRMWQRVGGHAALAGTTLVKQPAGRLTKLLASGFASQGAARTACASLKRSGYDCLVTK